MTTDCREDIGITVGIFDSIITMCRLLKSRNLSSDEVKEVLADLNDDEDFAFLKIITELPNDFPTEFIETLRTWGYLHKSPYGNSYYNVKVDWEDKPDKSFRIADHWNFKSQKKLHCLTTELCPNKTHWTLAQYDAKLGKYVIIKSILK